MTKAAARPAGPATLEALVAQASADPAAVSPADLAAVVTVTPPARLREAAGGPLRDLAIDVVLGRLTEFVDPARWTGDPVRLALRLTGRQDGGEDVVVLALDGVTATAGRDAAAGHDGAAGRDVEVAADALDLLLLVCGVQHAALLFLRGALRLDGDPQLAIAAAGCFRVPGIQGAGAGGEDLDPLAIDVEAVARVVGDLSDSDLRDRMRGGVRDIILGEIFGRFSAHLRADRTADVQAAIAWRITGRDDGEVDRYVTLIDHGAVRLVAPGSVEVRVSIQVPAADFLRLVTGNANPAMLFMRRRLSVRGDLGFAAQLTGMFVIPGH